MLCATALEASAVKANAIADSRFTLKSIKGFSNIFSYVTNLIFRFETHNSFITSKTHKQLPTNHLAKNMLYNIKKEKIYPAWLLPFNPAQSRLIPFCNAAGTQPERVRPRYLGMSFMT